MINFLKKYGFNEIGVLLMRLFILFILYQIMRIGFYLYNIAHFEDVSFSHLLYMMWGGLKFDLTAIIYLNLLFILLSILPLKSRNKKTYQKIVFYVFIITNAIGFAFNIMDIFYFDYILKRSTMDVFMFASEGNIGLLFLQFLKDYWIGFLVFILLVYITIKLYKLIIFKTDKEIKPAIYYPTRFVLMLIVVYFSIIGIRGGFTATTRPITLNNAGAFIDKPLEMAIVLNTPFTLLKTSDVQSFKRKKYFKEPKLSNLYSAVKHFETTKEFNNKNVVLIIVESLAKEYIGSLNKKIVADTYQGYTPFLDSLITQSHTYTNAFANGRKSIDALPSIVASVPSLVQPFIISPYSTNEINGLGDLLLEKGYKTAFFHGAPNGSMGFDAFMNTAGYKAYYGYNEYNNSDDFDGKWGIWDDKFLQYTAQTINDFKPPFLATIFTLSSHHPFKIPEEYKDQFKEGTLPIHKPIQYLDYSLQRFFSTASKMPWFKNTIFVITADHCNQTILPEYKSTVGNFSVPIIIYQPNKPETIAMDSTVSQQADILPKILRELNYSGDFISFGTDVITESRPFATNYQNQTWNYYEGEYLLQFRDEKSIGLYLYNKDRLLKNNLISKKQVLKDSLETRLKAYIQQYYNRLIDNKMTIKDRLH